MAVAARVAPAVMHSGGGTGASARNSVLVRVVVRVRGLSAWWIQGGARREARVLAVIVRLGRSVVAVSFDVEKESARDLGRKSKKTKGKQEIGTQENGSGESFYRI